MRGKRRITRLRYAAFCISRDAGMISRYCWWFVTMARGWKFVASYYFTRSLSHSFFQIVLAGPCVDHDGVQGFMAKKGRHLVERNAFINQILAECVAQGMWCDMGQPCAVGVFRHHILNTGNTQWATLAKKDETCLVFGALG